MLLAIPAAGATEDDGPDFDQFLTIKFADDSSSRDRLLARAAVGAKFELSLAGPLLQQASVPAGESANSAAQSISGDPAVEYAVASGQWTADAVARPYFNDEFLPKQWALDDYGQVFMSRLVNGSFQSVSGTSGVDIDAPEGWDLVNPAAPSFGDVTIGVIDTGIAYQHPDLAANTVEGRDLFADDDDPRDINGHGTHVASVAAGVGGNAIGTVGVDPWAKVMPLRAADEGGNFSWAAIEQAVAHGLANGVKLFNGSFGGPDNDPAFEELMAAHPEALFVFSSGNGGSDQLGDNHDLANGSAHRYPCDSQLENVICVGASDWTDQITRFSDFGVKSVDLLAPGASVYAAKPCTTPASAPGDETECPFDAQDPTRPVGLGGGPFAFQLLSGTSMAAPAVAGAAALVWQKCPALKSSQVKRAVVQSVDAIASVSSKVAYGGRLDLGGAIGAVSPCPATSGGSDWPVPPAQPTLPGGDGGDDGSPSGPTGGVTPPRVNKPGLTFKIIRPASARLARSNKVAFKIECSAACTIAASMRPVGRGLKLKALKGSGALGKAGVKKVSLKLPKRSLRSLRALLARGGGISLKFSVVVKDSSGASSSPVRFSVKVARR